MRQTDRTGAFRAGTFLAIAFLTGTGPVAAAGWTPVEVEPAATNGPVGDFASPSLARLEDAGLAPGEWVLASLGEALPEEARPAIDSGIRQLCAELAAPGEEKAVRDCIVRELSRIDTPIRISAVLDLTEDGYLHDLVGFGGFGLIDAGAGWYRALAAAPGASAQCMEGPQIVACLACYDSAEAAAMDSGTRACAPGALGHVRIEIDYTLTDLRAALDGDADALVLRMLRGDGGFFDYVFPTTGLVEALSPVTPVFDTAAR